MLLIVEKFPTLFEKTNSIKTETKKTIRRPA